MKLYHGLTIDRFLEHYQAGAIRGLSRDHFDSGNGVKGTWLTNDFDYIVKNQHGLEMNGQGEVLADWSDIFKKLGIDGDGLIRQCRHKTRVISEISDVPDIKRLTPHFMLPNQLFYFGDIPTGNVARVYVDQLDDAVRSTDINRLLLAGVPQERVTLYDRLGELVTTGEKK